VSQTSFEERQRMNWQRVNASVILLPERVQAIVYRAACGALTKESRSLVIHRQLSPHLQPSFHVNHLPLHCIRLPTSAVTVLQSVLTVRASFICAPASTWLLNHTAHPSAVPESLARDSLTYKQLTQPTVNMSTGAKKRIMKASHYMEAGAEVIMLTGPQEYGECMADTPPGMKINFDEQNMTKWEVLMDGPAQSAYAVGLIHAPSVRRG